MLVSMSILSAQAGWCLLIRTTSALLRDALHSP